MPYYTCSKCQKTYERREFQPDDKCIYCDGTVKMIAANRGEMMKLKAEEQAKLDEIRKLGLEEMRRKEEEKRERERREAKIWSIVLLITVPILAIAVIVAAMYKPVIQPAIIYSKGNKALERGEYQEAVTQFNQILNYKDSSYVLQKHIQDGLATVQVGEDVYMGRYEQDNRKGNGTELIAWRVIAIEDGRALLMSEKALDTKPFNRKYEPATWETCTLREWLNTEFFDTAFNSSEKELIQLSTIETPDNDYYGTAGGNATEDHIFILSIQEAKSLFAKRQERKIGATAYAKAMGAYQYSTTNTGSWWLRTPGAVDSYALFVDFKGNVKSHGQGNNWTQTPVVPVMWVTIP